MPPLPTAPPPPPPRDPPPPPPPPAPGGPPRRTRVSKGGGAQHAHVRADDDISARDGRDGRLDRSRASGECPRRARRGDHQERFLGQTTLCLRDQPSHRGLLLGARVPVGAGCDRRHRSGTLPLRPGGTAQVHPPGLIGVSHHPFIMNGSKTCEPASCEAISTKR